MDLVVFTRQILEGKLLFLCNKNGALKPTTGLGLTNVNYDVAICML